MKHTIVGLSLVLIALFAVNSGLAGSARAQDSPKNLYKIYSDLGKTLLGSCYSRTEGWDVGLGQSIAMAFSPEVNAEVKVVVLGLLYYSGEDVATVSINEDADGVPGKAIHTWTFRNLGKQLWHGCYTHVSSFPPSSALRRVSSGGRSFFKCSGGFASIHCFAAGFYNFDSRTSLPPSGLVCRWRTAWHIFRPTFSNASSSSDIKTKSESFTSLGPLSGYLGLVQTTSRVSIAPRTSRPQRTSSTKYGSAAQTDEFGSG